MNLLEGGCHCGNIRFTFASTIAPDDLVPNACDCAFCRKHDTRALSDPAGRLDIRVSDAAALSRYRFGTGFTDFLICRVCGVYIGAFLADGDGTGHANVMANALDNRSVIVRAAVVVHRSDEDADAKRARRRANWTPVTLTVGGG